MIEGCEFCNLFVDLIFMKITLSAILYHNKLIFTNLQRIVKPAKFTALKNFVLFGKKWYNNRRLTMSYRDKTESEMRAEQSTYLLGYVSLSHKCRNRGAGGSWPPPIKSLTVIEV